MTTKTKREVAEAIKLNLDKSIREVLDDACLRLFYPEGVTPDIRKVSALVDEFCTKAANTLTDWHPAED